MSDHPFKRKRIEKFRLRKKRKFDGNDYDEREDDQSCIHRGYSPKSHFDPLRQQFLETPSDTGCFGESAPIIPFEPHSSYEATEDNSSTSELDTFSNRHEFPKEFCVNQSEEVAHHSDQKKSKQVVKRFLVEESDGHPPTSRPTKRVRPRNTFTKESGELPSSRNEGIEECDKQKRCIPLSGSLPFDSKQAESSVQRKKSSVATINRLLLLNLASFHCVQSPNTITAF